MSDGQLPPKFELNTKGSGITTFIAIAGLIIGIINGWVSYNKYLAEQPHLQIIQAQGNASVFALREDANLEKDPYHAGDAVIWIRIENNSEKPMTISEFALDYRITDSSNYRYLSTSTTVLNENESVILNTKRNTLGSLYKLAPAKQLCPIFTIQPYDAKEGHIFFPHSIYTNDKNITANLIIHTTRGEFTQPITIFRVTDLN
jgi:hypothetical protein